MCLAIPAKIIKLNDNRAIVDIMGVESEISIELIKNAIVGDYVIVHAGCAISKVDEKEAQDTIRLFNELEEVINGRNK